MKRYFLGPSGHCVGVTTKLMDKLEQSNVLIHDRSSVQLPPSIFFSSKMNLLTNSGLTVDSSISLIAHTDVVGATHAGQTRSFINTWERTAWIDVRGNDWMWRKKQIDFINNFQVDIIKWRQVIFYNLFTIWIFVEILWVSTNNAFNYAL